MIRVLLADDQALVRGALTALLSLERDIEVVAKVGTGEEALTQAAATRPDVALLDVQMPGMDGLTAADQLRTIVPGCRVIVCTTFGRPGYLVRAMAAGAAGFVVKDAPPEQLVDAVRRVHAGLRVVDPVLAAESLASGRSPLTHREPGGAARRGARGHRGRGGQARTPIAGHRPQSPFRGDRQDRCSDQRGRGTPRRTARLALSASRPGRVRDPRPLAPWTAWLN